jgi:hypothetical protein
MSDPQQERLYDPKYISAVPWPRFRDGKAHGTISFMPSTSDDMHSLVEMTKDEYEFAREAVNSHATHLSTIEAQAKTIEAMKLALEHMNALFNEHGEFEEMHLDQASVALEKLDDALAFAQTEKK